MAATCIVTLPAGYFMGRNFAIEEIASPGHLFSARLGGLQEALDIALGELEMQRTRNAVDARALEMLRKEMAAERERTVELEEGLSFYRNLVAIDGPETGLYLHTPELVQGSAPNRITYRIIVQQKEREYETVEGALSVSISGSLGGDEVSYSLAELSQEVEESTVPLQFRYFQSLEGEMNLPEGFEPRELALVARATRPRESKVSEVFPWALQERLINVGE
jgi:hypothetical protein